MTTVEFHENRFSVDPIVIDNNAAAIDQGPPSEIAPATPVVWAIFYAGLCAIR